MSLMSVYIGPLCSPDREVEAQNREAVLAAWQESPPWGVAWRDFFESFSRCVDLKQPGVTVTDLWGCTSGETTSTVPQIREALTNAIEAGLVVLIRDEQPDGTR